MDVLLTSKCLWLVGRTVEKKGPNKGKVVEVVKRQIPLEQIAEIGLSTLQDDFVFVQVKDEWTSVLESPLKTELLTAMNKRYQERCGGRELPLNFANSHSAHLKKLKYNLLGPPGSREFRFLEDSATLRIRTQADGKQLSVFVPPGLPPHTSE